MATLKIPSPTPTPKLQLTDFKNLRIGKTHSINQQSLYFKKNSKVLISVIIKR